MAPGQSIVRCTYVSVCVSLWRALPRRSGHGLRGVGACFSLCAKIKSLSSAGLASPKSQVRALLVASRMPALRQLPMLASLLLLLPTTSAVLRHSVSPGRLQEWTGRAWALQTRSNR